MITALGRFGRPEDKAETNWKTVLNESFDVQLSGCGKAPAELGAGANARA